MDFLDSPPDLVKGSYATDLNINKIHDAICTRYDFFHRSIGIIDERIIHLIKELDTEKISHNEYKSLEKQINNLKKAMYDYKHNITYTK